MKQRKRNHRWFHCSSTRFPVGTTLNGVYCKRSWERSDVIFMNSDVCPHYTMQERFGNNKSKLNFHIYEVEPIGEVIYGGLWDEAMCQAVEVKHYVGTVLGYLNNHQIQNKKTWYSEHAVDLEQVQRWNKKRKRI